MNSVDLRAGAGAALRAPSSPRPPAASPSPASCMPPHDRPDVPAPGVVVDEVVQTVTARLAELQPYLEEAERLRAILAASQAAAPPATGTPAPAPGADAEAPRRSAGANKQEILAVIADQPGVTAADIARMSGMKRTVVASTVSRLKRTGELEPEGRGVRLPRARGTRRG